MVNRVVIEEGMASVERTGVRPNKEKCRWRFSRPNGLAIEGQPWAFKLMRDCIAQKGEPWPCKRSRVSGGLKVRSVLRSLCARYILRTVVNYDFSLALNIDRRVAQACNRTLLLLALAPCSRCPGLTQNFPIYNRSKYVSVAAPL